MKTISPLAHALGFWTSNRKSSRRNKHLELKTYPRANPAENMSGPGVGFEYPSVPVSWYKRDVLLFANAIGCDAKDELHFLYVCITKPK